ncbi:hypothetical protein Tco_0290607 [Tanacetum coccineum]
MGKANGEVEDLISVLGEFAPSCNCMDSWTWFLEDNGRFMVKALSRMVDKKYPHQEDSRQETSDWSVIALSFISRRVRPRRRDTEETPMLSLGYFAAKSLFGRWFHVLASISILRLPMGTI